tara:strand:- start:86793 stop:89162 length:2370 start_codon:yes stop_codon:yes gene_type:complete
MAYIFVTDNQTPAMTTSNPVTLTTTVGPATVAVAHIYGKNTARSATAPTYDGVTMSLSSSGSFMSTAGDWTRQETFYLINADVGTGSNIVLSVPNTTNESLYVDISFFYSEIDAVHHFDGSNSGEDLGPSTITYHYPIPYPATDNGVLFVDGIMERGGIYVTGSNYPGELIYRDETDDSKFLSQYFWNKPGNTNRLTSYTFTDEPSSFVGSLIVFNHHPTHVFNTANNINFGANNTPELYFTGSDVDGNDLHYEIQIDNTQPPFWATPSIYYTSSSEELPALNPYAFAGTPSYSPYFFNTEVGQTTEVPPFTQGSTIKYSIQPSDALSDGTWYWRISAWNGVGWSQWWLGEQAIYRAFEIETGATNSPPTVNLETPNGFNFGTDTTPTLKFTGYDVDGDDLTYEIEIDNLTDFVTPDISKASATHPGFLNSINGGDTDPFTESETISYTVQGADALADGTWYWRVRANDGTDWSSDWASEEIPRSFIIEAATNSTPTIVMNTPNLTDFGTNSTPTLEFTGSDSDSDDLNYEIRIFISGSFSNPDISKASDTDTGFVNTTDGGDTDPFTAGQTVSYTVQGGDALSDGTWYWSVRVNDGTVWSTWSTQVNIGDSREYRIFYVGGVVNVAPTIILNTPDGYDFQGDTTPSLVFTGSDVDGDQLSYDIMIATVSTFDNGNVITASSSVDDTLFTSLIADDPNDPWAQGHSIQYTPKDNNPLSPGTWHWVARAYDGELWSDAVKSHSFIIGTWSGSQWDSFFVESITKLNGRESIFGQSSPPFQKINGIYTLPG